MTHEGAIAAALVGYALGSIPFAWIVVRRSTGLDLRRVGSGNVGATNAARATGWKNGLLVLVLDISKGAAAVAVVTWLGAGDFPRAIAAFAAVVGHVFPLWLRFRGGKGVATACGAYAILAPAATAIAAAAFAAAFLSTRVVSVGSLAGSAALVGATVVLEPSRPVLWAVAATAALVMWRHADNIDRLVRGTEPRTW